MHDFSRSPDNYENTFIKHDRVMLLELFGTEDVVPFWVADMDFRVADPISKELRRLADRSVFSYEFSEEEVFGAIASWNKRRHALRLETTKFLQVPGVMTGIALLLRQLTEEGDGVLIQTPVFHQFPKVINTARRSIVRSPLRIRNGRYEMDLEDVERRLESGQAKSILLCSPHNPVGRVWKPEELQGLAAIAERYGVIIISDEIFSDIIYAGGAFKSIAAFDPEQHVALLGSPAKSFGMQSISNGYVYTENEDILRNLGDEIDSMYLSHGNAFTTFATIAAYSYGEEWLEELLSYLEATIAHIDSFLTDRLPEVRVYPVEGTYQLWIDFRELGLAEKQLEKLVFERAKLGLAPGRWFGAESNLFMRMNVASPYSKIEAALNRLEAALTSL